MHLRRDNERQKVGENVFAIAQSWQKFTGDHFDC